MSLEGIVDLHRAPVVLVQRRWQILLLLLAGAPFIAICLLAHRELGLLADLGAAFFAACAAVTLAMMLRPNRLTIGPAGLRFDEWFRSRSWRWSDVCDFTGDRDDLTFLHQGRRISLPLMVGWIGMEPMGWQGGLRLVSGLRLAPVMEEARARWA